MNLLYLCTDVCATAGITPAELIAADRITPTSTARRGDLHTHRRHSDDPHPRSGAGFRRVSRT